MLGQIYNLLMEKLALPVLLNEAAGVETPVQVGSEAAESSSKRQRHSSWFIGQCLRHQITNLWFGHTRRIEDAHIWARQRTWVRTELVVWAKIQIFFSSHQFIWIYRHLLATWSITAESRFFFSELLNFSSKVYFGICSIVVVMDVGKVLSGQTHQLK